jgi:omega-amidase
MPLPSSTTTTVEENADNSNNEIDSSSKQYPHYSAWGHSSIISPWGEVIATCDENPAVVIADLDMDKVEEMRMSIPTMIQKRHDLYRLVEGRSAPNDHSGST